MPRENERRAQDAQSNMWTAPAHGPSPALEALRDVRADEGFSLSESDKEVIRKRSKIFERQPHSENGQNFLP
ncbi:MAG: hypothetical protein H0U74_17615 [Bradymonadaceae bacterium]|nr:hypothetical protein [Lujinxingiaceae bacterium]